MVRLLLFILLLFQGSINSFLTEQKKFPRVRTAFLEKGNLIDQTLKKQGFQSNDLNILIVAYKSEALLEIYAAHKNSNKFEFLKSYNICYSAGKLGPKRKQGDDQVPEGFYHIQRFNPASSFHLSLGLNYPNEADAIKATGDPGGDIFIHGACVTIGCIPMTDDKIKEIYAYAVYAKNNGQSEIPVYVFPFKMTDENYLKYKKEYASDKMLIDFWDNLKHGYDFFNKNKMKVKFKVTKDGDYLFE